MSMEKKHSSSPTDACEKIFKAVTTCPARTIRRIGHRPQEPRSPSPASQASPATMGNTSGKTTHIQTKPVVPTPPKSEQLKTPSKKGATESVAINFDYAPPPSEKPNTKLADHAKTDGKQGPAQAPPPSVHKPLKTDPPVERNHKPKAQISSEVNKEQGNKTGIHIEDRFTDYIDRAKMKIRTRSNAGEAPKLDKTAPKVDKTAPKVDRKFSEYINRAKFKIRAMSGIDGGKHDSSK